VRSRLPPPRATLVPALLAAAVLAGCGTSTVSSRFTGVAHDAAQGVVNFMNDARNSDESKICANDLSTAAIARFSSSVHGQSCTTSVHNTLNEISDFSFDIKNVSVTGNTAKAVVSSVYGGHTRNATLTLVNEQGRWKVDDVQ
jgi:outer membrane PBP1 activator LpoA protein